MKKVLTLAAALLVFGASAAMAQGGLNLYYNECGLGGGANAISFLCNTNTGAAFALNASVVVPSNMPQFAATSAIIDIQVSGGSVPAWWQTATGQCRANAIGMSFDPAGNTSTCPDIWQFSPNLSVFQVQPGVGGPDRVRLNGGAAIPAGSELNTIADGSELWVCKVTISRTKTVSTGSCAGCLNGACIVLNECFLQQPAGVGNYRVTNPADNNYVTWNGGGTVLCPQATPSQNRTWGAVKNLYR